MIIYGSTLSPYVRKTVAFAKEKGIDFENKNAFGSIGGEDYLACSPFRKIPALRDGDFTLSDSTAIITYFDALKPDPILIPHEPKLRARTVWFEEFADTILIACMRTMFFNRIVSPKFLGKPGDEAMAAKAEAEELPPLIGYIESVMPDSGHLVGDRLTLADFAVASPFVNFKHLNWEVDPVKYSKTAAFVEAMHARPSFAALIASERRFLAA